MFGFIKEIEGVEFPEALRMLADRAGVTLRAVDPSLISERTKLFDICEAAARFFERELETSVGGKAAWTYLQERAVSLETRRAFRLGFAPARWDGLLKELRSAGFRDGDAERAGLAVPSRNENRAERHYDRFRSRIIFPIFDLSGKVVGFSGRIFGESGIENQESGNVEAKYINTPQTPIYDKGSILYGLDKAKVPIRKEDRAVLVEGNMDALMSHQAGIAATVATSGTALTDHHLKLLKRYSEQVVMAFDEDSAGAAATRRGVELAHRAGMNVRIVSVAGAKDPADLVKENAEAWRTAVASAKPILDFFFEKITKQFLPRSVEGKKAIGREFLPILALTANRIEQAHWVGEVSQALGVREEAVWAELVKAEPGESRAPARAGIAASRPQPTRSRLERLEEEVLAAALGAESRQELLAHLENPCISAPARVFFGLLQSADVSALEADGWRRGVDESYHGYIENVVWLSETLPSTPDERAATFVEGVRQLTKLKAQSELEALADEIRAAERAGEEERTENLLRRFQEVAAGLITDPASPKQPASSRPYPPNWPEPKTV